MGARALAVLCVVGLTGCPRAGEEDLRKGNVYFSTKQFDKAATHYEAAAKDAPKSARAREGRADVAYEQGQLSVAVDWYRKAIEANDNAITPRHKLAVALAAQGKLDAAQKVLEDVLAQAPNNPYALSSLGGLLAKKGDLAGAEKRHLDALKLDPQYHAARFSLGNLLLDTGRTEDAERQFTRLVAEGKPAVGAYGLARVAAKLGKPAMAAKQLETVIAAKVSAPDKILTDAVFTSHWAHPAMAAVRSKLGAPATKTSTTP